MYFTNENLLSNIDPISEGEQKINGFGALNDKIDPTDMQTLGDQSISAYQSLINHPNLAHQPLVDQLTTSYQQYQPSVNQQIAPSQPLGNQPISPNQALVGEPKVNSYVTDNMRQYRRSLMWSLRQYLRYLEQEWKTIQAGEAQHILLGLAVVQGEVRW